MAITELRGVSSGRVSEHISLKDYPANLQPRERLFLEGAERLSEIELLAILLSTGAESKTALDLARELCLNFELRALQRASVQELIKLPGIGPAKAARIVAALELGRRQRQLHHELQTTYDSPESVYAYLAPLLGHQQQEHFSVLLLDIKCRLIRHKVLSVGTLEGTLVHPREIFREALNAGAYALVVAHNHPSGDPEPSACDLNTTRQLIRCGKLMQIECLDHVIIGQNSYWSIRAHSPALWTQNELLE